MTDRWFYSTSEDLWYDGGETRETAISAGRNEHGPDSGFEIAKGHFKGPWGDLFDGGEALGEYIDQHNEDNAFEDAFCEEAGISNADLEPVVAQINSIWQAFLERHKPVSNSLNLYEQEKIPAEEIFAPEPSGDQ